MSARNGQTALLTTAVFLMVVLDMWVIIGSNGHIPERFTILLGAGIIGFILGLAINWVIGRGSFTAGFVISVFLGIGIGLIFFATQPFALLFAVAIGFTLATGGIIATRLFTR